MQKRTIFLLGFLMTTVLGWSESCIEGIREIHCTLKPFNRPKAPTTKITTANQLFTSDIGSSNWSGYVAVSNSNPVNSVTYVAGTWTVPTLLPTPTGTSYTAIWVGIDGFGSGTVEQIGTGHEWVISTPGSFGQQVNNAWYEMYPGAGYDIVGFPVDPGDQISASITYLGDYAFLLKMTNITKKVATNIPSLYTTSLIATRASAEWVVEAPSGSTGVLPLADFKSVTFQSCDAIINGVLGPINSPAWKNDLILMETPQGQTKAAPSALTNVSSFNVTWDHE